MATVEEALKTAQHYQQTHRLPQAEALYRQILQVHPNHPLVFYQLGLLAHQVGKPEVAIGYLKKAIQHHPQFVEAHCNLAMILNDCHRIEESIAFYQEAIKINPTYIQAYNNLAVLFFNQGQWDNAYTYYQKALEINPSIAQIHNNLGKVHYAQGELDAAKTAYQKAIELQPDFADAYTNLGAIFETQGQLEKAIQQYRKALSCHVSWVSAYYHLGRITAFTDAERIQVEHLIQQSQTTNTDRKLLHFALASNFNRSHRYDEAFHHAQEANRLHRREIQYNGQNHHQFFHTFIEVFNQAYLDNPPHQSSNSSESPIFIVGMPRSGTTLVEQIIASHPQAFGGGEIKHLPMMIEQLVGTDPPLEFAQKVASIRASEIADLTQSYLSYLDKIAPTAKRVTDKMPSNFIFLGLISRLFPNAKIIHCRRNALDTCVSCYFMHFNEHHLFSYDLKELGEYYQAYEQLMKHWHQVLSIPILDVDYESLVDQQETTSRSILSFCGLEWAPECLSFYQHRRSLHTASTHQVRQPIYRSSLGRWRHYEKFLTPLKEALKLP